MNRHESQRGYFAYYLHEAMQDDKSIWVLTGDLGFGMLDAIKEDFPDRFVNCGAAEQAMMGIAVGLAQQGQKPFVYSITPFLIYRPFETIRNYVAHEKAAVRLVGGGRDKDYTHDGFSHDATDVDKVLHLFPEIHKLSPATKEDVRPMLKLMIEQDRPWFLSLKR